MLIPDDGFNRCWIVAVARIIELWAIGDEADDVALSHKFDVAAGRRDTVFKGKLTFRRHWNVHKEIDVTGDVTLAELGPPFMKPTNEDIAAGVHVLFLMRITHCVTLT